MSGDDWRFDYSVEQMRMQRHDFMNYLQVIYGYIQVNKPEEAITYIKQINNKISVHSLIFNIECADLSVIIQDFFNFCSKYGINVEFNSDLECISPVIISKNINDIKKCFEYIKTDFYSHIVEIGKDVFINLCGGPENFTIFIANDEILCESEILNYLKQDIELNEDCVFYSYSDEDGFVFRLDVK